MTSQPPLKKQPKINIREEMKNHIRKIANMNDNISLLEKVSQNINDRLNAEELKKKVMNSKSGTQQFFINEETLKRYISERVRIELKQILQNAV